MRKESAKWSNGSCLLWVMDIRGIDEQDGVTLMHSIFQITARGILQNFNID